MCREIREIKEIREFSVRLSSLFCVICVVCEEILHFVQNDSARFFLILGEEAIFLFVVPIIIVLLSCQSGADVVLT